MNMLLYTMRLVLRDDRFDVFLFSHFEYRLLNSRPRFSSVALLLILFAFAPPTTFFPFPQPLASPLTSSYIVAFRSMASSESYARFYRSSTAAIDVDVIDRLLPGTTGYGTPPTILYDGATHLRYKFPARNWEMWYCGTPPGKGLGACTFLRSNIFDLAYHHKGVEMRKHPIKGRALYATEPMSKNHFVAIDDTAWSISIDAIEWRALNDFIEAYPDATMYKGLRDWWVAYGFESYSLGMTGWSVSLASTNTFSNHACSDREVNTGPCDFVFLNEDNGYVGFSPVINRYPKIAAMTACVIRDINPGDEMAMDYIAFREEAEGHPYYEMFLTEMCQSGKGMVKVDEEQRENQL